MINTRAPDGANNTIRDGRLVSTYIAYLSKNGLSGVCTLLTLGGAGGLTVENRSTIGVPLKTLGYYASNELCGRSVASKLIPQQAGGLFHQGDTEIGENLHFFIKRSTPENFQCDNFPGGGPMESLGDHASEYV